MSEEIKETTNEQLTMRNSEHYPDPTAFVAIKNADRTIDADVERHHKLIGALLRICELSDYEVMDRIVVKDKRTGRVWR